MAVDPTAAERAYDEIKRRLLEGAFHLRQRLDAQTLARELGVSTTPVREALVRLTGERVIASRRAHGYYLALWTEEGLRWLYSWRADLAELASDALAQAVPVVADQNVSYSTRTSLVLQRLHASGNPEWRHAAINADDRLHGARRAEHEIWADADEELAALADTVSQGDRTLRRTALRAFHRRRLAHVRQIRERALLIALGPNGP